MKYRLVSYLAIALLVFSGRSFASELEIVEQDKIVTEAAPQPAPEQAPAVLPQAQAVAPVLAPVVPDSEASEKTARYTLGPDDIIEIVVRRHAEFSGVYSLNFEGKIQYKFVGDIELKGLTKVEVKEKITGLLSKFIVKPEVDITILEYRSKVIYVIGEVGAPGKYYMRSDEVSLREAVIQAGLPTLSSSMRRTQLIRPDKSGKPRIKTIDLYALLYEGKLELDQIMLPGDVLVVPATVFAKIMRVVSPVAAPVASTDTLRRAATGGI